MSDDRICELCSGTGIVDGRACPNCGGVFAAPLGERQHHEPPRKLHDRALVEATRCFDEIVAVEDGLDPTAFAAVTE